MLRACTCARQARRCVRASRAGGFQLNETATCQLGVHIHRNESKQMSVLITMEPSLPACQFVCPFARLPVYLEACTHICICLYERIDVHLSILSPSVASCRPTHRINISSNRSERRSTWSSRTQGRQHAEVRRGSAHGALCQNVRGFQNMRPGKSLLALERLPPISFCQGLSDPKMAPAVESAWAPFDLRGPMHSLYVRVTSCLLRFSFMKNVRMKWRSQAGVAL